jgi:hypothetical protein
MGIFFQLICRLPPQQVPIRGHHLHQQTVTTHWDLHWRSYMAYTYLLKTIKD